MERQRLSLSAFLLSFTLLVSKLLGFIKESLMAKYFGTSGSVDAYVAARGTIESISGLLTAGVAVALVPIFSEYITRGKEKEGWLFLSRAFKIFTVFLMAVSLLGMVAAPVLVRVLFSGFSKDVSVLAVVCLRGLFIYFIFVEMGSFLQAVHQSRRAFSFIVAWQLIPNFVIIFFVIMFSQTLGIFSVVYGFLFTAPLYFFFFYPPYVRWMRRANPETNPETSASVNDGLQKMGRMILPLMVGQSFSYVVFFVDRYLASHLPQGSMASLNYANRVIQLPPALLTLPVTAVLYPVLSASKSTEEFSRTMFKGLRFIFFVLFCPCLFFLGASLPIVRLLFERGAFKPDDTLRVAVVLRFFAPMFLFGGLTHIVLQGYYARQDTKTPLQVTLYLVMVNVVLSILFVRLLLLPGLALAATLSTVMNFIVLIFLFRRKFSADSHSLQKNFMAKMLVVGVLTFISIRMMVSVFESPYFLSSLEKRFFGVCVTGGVSCVIYFTLSFLFKVDELLYVWRDVILPFMKKITRFFDKEMSP